MSTTLLLLVIGGTIVMVDLNVNGTGFVPDVLGFLVLAVAGARLAAQPVDDPDLRKSLRAAGAGLSAVAVISGID